MRRVLLALRPLEMARLAERFIAPPVVAPPLLGRPTGLWYPVRVQLRKNVMRHVLVLPLLFCFSPVRHLGLYQMTHKVPLPRVLKPPLAFFLLLGPGVR